MNHELSKNIDSSENPWENFSMRELPTTSPNQNCNLYLRQFERLGLMDKIAHFINEKLSTTPKTYTSVDEFKKDNPDYMKKLDSLSQDEKAAIREYSGFRFAWINSYLRGFWDYEKMGLKTPELENRIKDSITKIDAAFSDAPAPDKDFLTFRGTNIDSFRSYGIQNPEDLKNLEGQLYLEEGFTSTALVKNRNFAEHKIDSQWYNDSDIEIQYHIPAGSHDSIALFDKDLSYNPEQTEVLINKNALSYIHKVQSENGRTVVHALLIPREIYEK